MVLFTYFAFGIGYNRSYDPPPPPAGTDLHVVGLRFGHVRPNHSPRLGHVRPNHSPRRGHVRPNHSPRLGHVRPNHSPRLGHVRPNHSPRLGHVRPNHSPRLGHVRPNHSPRLENSAVCCVGYTRLKQGNTCRFPRGQERTCMPVARLH